MADRYLLIPGTGAVNFSDAEGGRASYLVEILLSRFQGWTERVVAELSCAHPAEAETPWGPSRTSLGPGDAALTPREVLMASAYDVVDTAKYELFPYDWRLDIRHNALQLLDLIADGSDRWHLLTHSQGGLIAVAASLMCDDAAEWHAMVGKMCLVAPPLMGTLNAMDAMIRGNNFGNMNSEFFRRAARTWPALFQMFPQFPCVGNEPTTRSTSAGLWPDEDEDFHNLRARAKETFQWLAYDPFRNVDGARLMVVLGKNPASNTHVAVTATDEGPVMSFETVRGDTLVPYDITVELLEWSGVRNRLLTVSGPHQPEHFRLLGDARVYEKCDLFL